jgi:hypothetical protein
MEGPDMIDHRAFFDRSREKLGHFRQSQVDGMELMLECWEYIGWLDLRWASYAFATAWWETDHAMQPVEEKGRGADHIYGLPAGPDRLLYYGRGLPQLTWYKNYVKCSVMLNKLGFDEVDMAKHPEQMLNPSISALVLFHGMEQGQFTGHKFADYFPKDGPAQPVLARQIINLNDHATEVASLYDKFAYAFGAGP